MEWWHMHTYTYFDRLRIFHDTPTLDGFAYKEKTVKTDRSEI